MKKIIYYIKNKVFIYRKVNIYVFFLLVLGIILGSIFNLSINIEDKVIINEEINTYISNISNDSVSYIISFKNSIITNFIYLTVIYILGLTLIGLVFNSFLVFIKGFISGFTMTSFITILKLKGALISIIYFILGNLTNILLICIMLISSIIFSIKLYEHIFKENKDIKKEFKKYTIIYVICLLISIISSVGEVIFLPNIIKLFVSKKE